MMETNTARIELRDKQLLIVRIKDGAYQSLADARENLATAIAEGQNRRRRSSSTSGGPNHLKQKSATFTRGRC
jgi:hypothetical protein